MSQSPPSSSQPVPVRPVQIQSLTPTVSQSSAIPVVPAPAIPSASVSQRIEPVAAEVAYLDEEEPVIQHAPVAPPRKNLMVEYWRKIGAGSFLLSILIHVGLFMVAAVIVIPQFMAKQPVDFLPGGGSKAGQEASQQLAQNVKVKKRSTLNKQTPIKKVVSTSTNSTIALQEVPMDTIDMPEMSSLLGGSMGSGGFGSQGSVGGFGKGIGIGGQAGFVSLPASMKSRCSSAERLQKLRESGGTAECERAVSNALEYLKTKQKPDGSWGNSNKAAMTGLALLCYLGRCETPDSPFYGDNVMKGILYLLELQKKNQAHKDMPHSFFCEKPESISSAYEHGIATYALGEMYTLARMGSKSLPGMREAFEKGVELIIEHQNETGGWDYYTKLAMDGKKNSARDDLSVTGWQFQALKAAKLTSLKINGLHPSISKTVKYLEGTQTKEGGFGGTNRETHYNQWNMTPIGILGIATLGKGPGAPEIKKALGFTTNLITTEPPVWAGGNSYGAPGNKLYTWYYFQQAFFQAGGEAWKQWNTTILPQVLQAQKPDGSWVHESGGAGGDNVYGTALCTLMMEVYYRYLKVADREAGSLFDK